MKVKELIALLEECDGEANVLLMTQEAWPFENDALGIAVRDEVEEVADGEDEPAARATGTAPNDVFIVEGTQLRYGSKSAWDAVRRP